jgi:malonate decarboxylase delta subunit
MEHFTCDFDGGDRSPKEGVPFSLVGVVASSNLEVLAQPSDLGGKVRFEVSTTIPHFEEAWRAVFADFIERNRPRDTIFAINDFAAIPPVVSLRLDQAWEGLL